MRARSAESLSVYVRQRSFRRVMRGYDPAEVDRHLETLSQMIAAGAIGDLAREQEERLGEREAGVEARELQARSQKAEAERLLEEARVEADATVHGAELKAAALEREAARLLDEARLQAEASEITDAARAEAERILGEAQTEAERILGEA
jgi:DivIVA domain-containing protein